MAFCGIFAQAAGELFTPRLVRIVDLRSSITAPKMAPAGTLDRRCRVCGVFDQRAASRRALPFRLRGLLLHLIEIESLVRGLPASRARTRAPRPTRAAKRATHSRGLCLQVRSRITALVPAQAEQMHAIGNVAERFGFLLALPGVSEMVSGLKSVSMRGSPFEFLKNREFVMPARRAKPSPKQSPCGGGAKTRDGFVALLLVMTGGCFLGGDGRPDSRHSFAMPGLCKAAGRCQQGPFADLSIAPRRKAEGAERRTAHRSPCVPDTRAANAGPPRTPSAPIARRAFRRSTGGLLRRGPRFHGPFQGADPSQAPGGALSPRRSPEPPAIRAANPACRNRILLRSQTPLDSDPRRAG